MTQDRRGEIAASHSGEDSVVQAQPFPSGRVLPQCDLIESAALVVIQDRLWELGASGATIIRDVNQPVAFHNRR